LSSQLPASLPILIAVLPSPKGKAHAEKVIADLVSG
jgi:hypothetical protein